MSTETLEQILADRKARFPDSSVEEVAKAWRRVEDMMPEEWKLVSVRRGWGDPLAPEWFALAAWTNLAEEDGGGFEYRASEEGFGLSAAAALDDLAATLSALPVMDGGRSDSGHPQVPPKDETR